MNDKEYKNCPYCDEKIKAIAIKCRYCKSMLIEDSRSGYHENAKPSNSIISSDKKSGLKVFLYIIAGLIVIGFISIMANVYSNESKTSYVNNAAIDDIQQDLKVDTISWFNGTYTGEIKGGKPHGVGEFVHPATGDKYVGEWENGKYHGQGIYTWGENSDVPGDKYIGEWKDGEPHGQGIRYYHTFQIGVIEDNYVIYQEGQGYKYEGDWNQGKRHGFGTYMQPYGEEYIARMLEQGYQPEVYIGEWKNDIRHGHGIKYWSNGTIYKGYFAENDLIRGEITSSDGSIYYRDGLTHTGYAPEWWDGSSAEVPQWWYEDPERTTYAGLSRDAFKSAMDRTGSGADTPSAETANYAHLVDETVFVDIEDDEVLLVRNGPGSNYGALDRLLSGTVLKVIGVQGEWLVVTYKDKGGFVHGAYVSKQDNLQSSESQYDDATSIAFVDGSKTDSERLNLRSGPGTDYDVVDKLNPETEMRVIFEVIGSDGEKWLEVVTLDGKEGWVHEGYIRWLVP